MDPLAEWCTTSTIMEHNQMRNYHYPHFNPLELRPPSSNQYCQESATKDKVSFKRKIA